MEILKTILVILEVLSAVGIIVLVLLQQGKGADAGASFGGGGSSGSVFGSVGSANFLSRSTAYLATLFIVSTILLAFFASGRTIGSSSVLENAPVAPITAPVAPAPTDGIPK